jgi:N-acetylglucosamine-6-phosphate deacetylase
MSDADTRVTVLSCGSAVLPDRIAAPVSLVIESGLIVDVVTGPRAVGDSERVVDLTEHIAVPGFIDVHVHGLLGADTLDGAGVGAVARIAAALPQFGVTAFAPTSVACSPAALGAFLVEVGALRSGPPTTSARVLPAHLESNFISPDYCGAQPIDAVRLPRRIDPSEPYSGPDVLNVIDDHRADVGTITLAPEIDGGLDLVRELAATGVRVSLGHSGATFDQAQAAFAAGARQATHLFNRMSPLESRSPGLTGAALANDDVAVELIGDGRHVHPAVVRLTVAAKGPARVMAISDGTAGAGLTRGAEARLAGRRITVDDVARLDDGTIAGSVATLDRVFICLVTECGIDLVTAAVMCSTTPARQLGLIGLGVIAPGAVADLTILNPRLEVVQTWIGGHLCWERDVRSGGL